MSTAVTSQCPISSHRMLIVSYCYLQSAVKLVSQSTKVNQRLEVPSREVRVKTASGEVEVKPPSVYLGYKPVQLLLLCTKWRGSQVIPTPEAICIFPSQLCVRLQHYRTHALLKLCTPRLQAHPLLGRFIEVKTPQKPNDRV